MRFVAGILAAALMALGLPAPASAQAAGQSADSAQQPVPQIGAVIILGNEALPVSRYQAALNSYFGAPADEETLGRLLDQLAQLARDEGYAYASAQMAPATHMRGMIQITINEGRIDEVRVEGYENEQAVRILERLRGSFAHRPTLESALLHVSDIPALRLRSATFKREDGRGVFVVGLARREHAYRLDADNYGTASFGPLRARASARLTDVLTSSDEVTAAIRINPVDLDELMYFSASYEAQVSAGGPRIALAASIGNTSPGGNFAGTELTGNSVRASLTLTQPVLRTRKASVWVDAEFAYLSIEQDVLDTLLRSDTVVTAAVGLRAQIDFDKGRVGGGVRHVRGLDLFNATRRGTALASRSDGDAVFSRIEAWLDARLNLSSRVQAYVMARGQIADRALLASQEQGLGGAYTVRGYDFAQVLGDEGLYGLAELRYTVPTGAIPIDALQFYAFADGGYVSDIGTDVGEGSLFSAGPGLRARIGPVDMELESAFPLGGSADRNASNNPEINLRAGLTF